MIKDFETVIKQLQELSTVINNFKSEAIQLRIIELLFKGVTVKDNIDGEEDDHEDTPPPAATGKRKRKKRTSKKGENVDPERKTTATKGRPGPLKTLEKLVADGYFKTKKAIGNIVEHCKDNLTLTYKSTDLSGSLMKLVRDKKLKREKNSATSQYEYINA
jgi:hypothetical protein